MKVVSFEERIVASLIHTCRATPRRRTTTVPASLMTAQLSRRFNAQQLTLHCQPGMDREQRTLSVQSTYAACVKKQSMAVGMAQQWMVALPSLFEKEVQITPGRSAKRRSWSCVSLGGHRTALSACIPVLVLGTGQQHSETQTKQLPAVAVFRARESSLFDRRLVRR
jgi:hypothetical protein